MQVKLFNNWFAPDGSLYQASHSPHNFPDSWKDKLPKTAKILDEDKEEEPKGKK